MWLVCANIFYLWAILEDFTRIYAKEIKKLFYTPFVFIWDLHMDVKTSFIQEKNAKFVCTLKYIYILKI